MTSSTTNRTDAARTAGPVTTSATAGAGIAGAATVLIVWGLNAAGVDVPAEVAQAITVLLAAAGALVGGWLAPSQADAVAQAVAAHSVDSAAVAQHVTDQVLEAGQAGMDSTQVAALVGQTAEQVVRAQAERAAVTDPSPRPVVAEVEQSEDYAPAHAAAVVDETAAEQVQVPEVETVDPAQAGPVATA